MKSIPISTARRLAQEHGATRLVILALGNGTFNWTSYGATSSDCRAMRGLAEREGEAWAIEMNEARDPVGKDVR